MYVLQLSPSVDLYLYPPGVFCKTWDVMLPRSLIGISHSCVVVPCSYSVPDDQETKLLNCSNRGIWKKGSIHGANILNSRSPSTNVIEVGCLTL